MRRVLNSFLQFIEQDSSDSIIVAATNNQRMLDKALFRRFDDVIHYSIPSEEEIRRLYTNKLNLFAPRFQFSNILIEKSDSLSHAEISRICDDAIKNSILLDVEMTENYLINLINERLAVYSQEVQ